MELECGSCGEHTIIEYAGHEPICFCPICGNELADYHELEFEEDEE